MKVRQLDHMDDFGNGEQCWWIDAMDIPPELISIARLIDRDDYSEACFGVCIVRDNDGWWVCSDTGGSELYYIDNDGYKHWLEYCLTAEEAIDFIDYCKNYKEKQA